MVATQGSSLECKTSVWVSLRTCPSCYIVTSVPVKNGRRSHEALLSHPDMSACKDKDHRKGGDSSGRGRHIRKSGKQRHRLYPVFTRASLKRRKLSCVQGASEGLQPNISLPPGTEEAQGRPSRGRGESGWEPEGRLTVFPSPPSEALSSSCPQNICPGDVQAKWFPVVCYQ